MPAVDSLSAFLDNSDIAGGDMTGQGGQSQDAADRMPSANAALPSLALVVPCYNEQEVLPHTAEVLAALLAKLVAERQVSADSAVYFVDDGSSDRTWELIAALNTRNPALRGIRLSRNVGHQRALLAGMLNVEADVVITMDANLQDDPAVIGRMLLAHAEGADVVYGVRNDRQVDTTGKRITARLYYRLMLRLLGVKLIEDHADFRLMSRRAVAALAEFPERNLFLRAMVPLVGFPWTTVEYARAERSAGVTKYSPRKMLSFAVDGITAFSVAPLRLIFWLGLVTALLSFGASAWAFLAWSVGGVTIPGWTSIVLPMTLLGGVQLISLGVLGEYLARIYTETKRRPHYFVQERL